MLEVVASGESGDYVRHRHHHHHHRRRRRRHRHIRHHFKSSLSKFRIYNFSSLFLKNRLV